ncbi:MAG TPA: HlyD family secretion protein [Vicinamibacterales bacterium]|nr:HlyD family secretion protein [Vicinamibacterales bacterium]
MARARILIPVVIAIVIAGAVWLWVTAGRESTDDAQTEAHVVQIAARVGGTVTKLLVKDNQTVEAGATLVEIDPRDYQIAVDRARADLADAEAAAKAAQSNVPVTSIAAESNVTTATGGVRQAGAAIEEADKGVEAARARLEAARSNVMQAQAHATQATRDVARLKGLLAKDEVSQQQYDAAVATADAQQAAVDAAKGGVAEAEAGVRVAQSRLMQAQVSEQQAQASLKNAQTAPQQIAAIRARAAAAEAHAEQLRAQLAQAELNLQYATVKAPAAGYISRKTVEVGQIIQPGQPLMALIELNDVWVVANFKETQLQNMRPGQRATVKIDALGDKEFTGHVDSLAGATGARFSLLPPENATGNFVKVVQRVPVKIVLDPNQDPEHLLRPGLSAEPTVYTK